MVKDKLKNGDILETNSEGYYIYLETEDKFRNLLSLNGGFMRLDSYDDELKCHGNPEDTFTIKKIFRFDCNLFLIGFIKKQNNINKANLIWERNRIKEMTVSEIEKELGITGLRIKKED